MKPSWVATSPPLRNAQSKNFIVLRLAGTFFALAHVAAVRKPYLHNLDVATQHLAFTRNGSFFVQRVGRPA